LAKTQNIDPTRLELLLRLGQVQRFHRNRDSARVLFGKALQQAQALVGKSPTTARSFTRLGEALMELDSADVALPYLELAAYVADAPQELGRVYLAIGHCHDLAGRRETAVKAYETVFSLPATYHDDKAARYYVNHIYKH
jgi:tetratricopeptide (TPR) repeat protein